MQKKKLFELFPFWDAALDTWVITDPRVHLTNEPFTEDARDVINWMLEDQYGPGAAKEHAQGFRLIFADHPFASNAEEMYQFTLKRTENGGARYDNARSGLSGLLTASLRLYFNAIPQTLFVKVLPKA